MKKIYLIYGIKSQNFQIILSQNEDISRLNYDIFKIITEKVYYDNKELKLCQNVKIVTNMK